DDDTAIWFYQIINGEIRVIDCLSDSGKDLAYYVKQLTGREVAINIRYGKVEVDIGDLVPELWRRSQYDYAGIYIPHDAKAKTLAAQGKSIQEQLNKVFGSNKVCIVPNLSIQDGILAARQMMPRVYMHERCEEGWEALKQYRREWDDKKHMLTDKPVHDWTSHYADAFRYLAVMWREKKEPTVIVPTMTTLTDVTFNDLWQQIPSKRKRI
ncbi:MAG: hypothetical protein MI867_21760, partial [Pseudomonadales bacterium]|nr:hypothetical protein [Pseudomonadales bacterium]